MNYDNIVAKVSETLVTASSTFREDKNRAYQRAIEKRKQPAIEMGNGADCRKCKGGCTK